MATTNMKRQISVRARSQSLSFLQVSPSKRRTLRKQSLPLTTSSIASPSPSVLTDVGGSSSSASLEEDICLYSSGNDSDTCQSGDESSYMKRQKRSADHWSKVHNQMLHAAVECGIPSSLSSCILCKEPADVTCLECGFQAVYCVNCAEAVHSTQNIFHAPQLMKVVSLHSMWYFFTVHHNYTEWPFLFKQPRVLCLRNHSCSSAYMKQVVCLDQKGMILLIAHNYCSHRFSTLGEYLVLFL